MWHALVATCFTTCLGLQQLHKVDLSSTLAVEFGFTSCNYCRDFLKPLQVVAQDSNVSHVSCNLKWIFSNIARQIARKIPLCNTSCRVRFCFLQRLQRFFEAIASCSPRFQRVTCLLQLEMDFFPMLRDKLQGKLHCVIPTVEFGFTSCNDCRDFLKLLQVAAQDSNV